MIDAVVRDADEGLALWTMGLLMTIRVGSAQTDGRLAAMEMLMPPDAAPPLHIHHNEDELNYVLEGEITMQCGERVWECGPGSMVFLPRGVPHAFRPGRAGARMLGVVTPGGLENLYAAVGQPALERRIPGIAPNIAGWMGLAEQYGLELAGPPLPQRA